MKAFSLASSAGLITGSTQGIGHAIALGLQEAGAGVVFHGPGERPATVPANAAYVAGDLFKLETPGALVTAAFQANAALDLLVCNAGSFFDLPFLDMDPDRWAQTINLNVRATYFVVQAFARELVARKRSGAIVILSSTNGLQSEPDSTAYDTSKGALVMMTRTLAHSLAPHRIRVNSVAPGLIHTNPSIAPDPPYFCFRPRRPTSQVRCWWWTAVSPPGKLDKYECRSRIRRAADAVHPGGSPATRREHSFHAGRM